MMKSLDGETIGHGIGTNEVGETDNLEPRGGVADLLTVVACFSHLNDGESSCSLAEGMWGRRRVATQYSQELMLLRE